MNFLMQGILRRYRKQSRLQRTCQPSGNRLLRLLKYQAMSARIEKTFKVKACSDSRAFRMERGRTRLAVSISKMYISPIPALSLLNLAHINPIIDTLVQESQSPAVLLHTEIIGSTVTTKFPKCQLLLLVNMGTTYSISANRTARSRRPTPPHPSAQNGPLIPPISANENTPVAESYDVFLQVIVPSFLSSRTISHLPSPSISAKRIPLRSKM